MYSAVGAAGRRLHVTQAQLRFATCRVAAVPLTRWLAGKPGQAVLRRLRRAPSNRSTPRRPRQLPVPRSARLRHLAVVVQRGTAADAATILVGDRAADMYFVIARSGREPPRRSTKTTSGLQPWRVPFTRAWQDKAGTVASMRIAVSRQDAMASWYADACRQVGW